MTTKEFIKLEKSLLLNLPSFTYAGRLMLIAPVKQVLRGICFEPSTFNKTAFYVNVFVLPFCVPTNHLYFNFGRRVGTGWSADMPNLVSELSSALKQQALPFLSDVESLDGFIETAKSFSFQNPHTHEAIAYALARAGEVDKSVAALDELARLLDVKVPWQLEMLERASALKSQLLSDASGAQKQLEAWEAESVRNLGLEKFQ